MITRLEIPCVCGYLGRMIGTSNYDDEGKQRVKFCVLAHPHHQIGKNYRG